MRYHSRQWLAPKPPRKKCWLWRDRGRLNGRPRLGSGESHAPRLAHPTRPILWDDIEEPAEPRLMVFLSGMIVGALLEAALILISAWLFWRIL